jgi:hypothetical protein
MFTFSTIPFLDFIHRAVFKKAKSETTYRPEAESSFICKTKLSRCPPTLYLSTETDPVFQKLFVLVLKLNSAKCDMSSL